jgi:tRNA pseudouridine synthase 10
MDIIEQSHRILSKYPLCDHCLGRQYAFLGYGVENKDRGRVIKTFLTMKGHREALLKEKNGLSLLRDLSSYGSFPMASDILRNMKRRSRKKEDCILCKGIFDRLLFFADKIIKAIEEYEYETFLVGVKLPVGIEEKEDEFRAEFDIQHGESMRNEFSRIIGKMIVEKTGKAVDFMKPQIVILVNPFTEVVNLQVNSLFIMGRYRKLLRGIPQSKWLCQKCRGEGCTNCDGTGKMYLESVEELIAKPAMEISRGEDSSFHGAGREDIDARMLGHGRPFIIQVKKPHKRKLDLYKLEQDINDKSKGKIEVKNLSFVDRKSVRKLKCLEASQKKYRVKIKFSSEITDDMIKKIEESLTNTTIIQQTPRRVLHRRGDLAREKDIYETRIKRISLDSIEMRVRCQGGLYIKELVTGDEGRTDPNISKIVGINAIPLELDVMDISSKGWKR